MTFIFIHVKILCFVSFSNLAYAHNVGFYVEGNDTNDSIKQQLQSKWSEIPDGYGLLRFWNNAQVYTGVYYRLNAENGIVLFASPAYGIIRTLTVNGSVFDVQSQNNYDMTHNRYITSLPAGKYYMYGSEDVGLPEPTNFFCEICDVDSVYKTIKLIPSDSGKRYFYLSKCVHGVWQGWEKYSGVSLGGVLDVAYAQDCNNLQDTGMYALLPETPNGPGFYGMLRHTVYPNDWKFQEAIEVNGLQRSMHRGWTGGVWGNWVS